MAKRVGGAGLGAAIGAVAGNAAIGAVAQTTAALVLRDSDMTCLWKRERL